MISFILPIAILALLGLIGLVIWGWKFSVKLRTPTPRLPQHVQPPPTYVQHQWHQAQQPSVYVYVENQREQPYQVQPKQDPPSLYPPGYKD